MYVYYKDKNDTIGFVKVKDGLPHRFEIPVFVFHIELDTVEKQLAEQYNLDYQLLGINPYELACVSRNLNCCFQPQEHMFTFKTIQVEKKLKINNNNH